MSIETLVKATLIGLSKDETTLLKELQVLGCMHVLPLSNLPSKVEQIAPGKADKTYKALKYLSDLPSKRRQITKQTDFDVEDLSEQVLALQLDIRRAEDKKALLEQRLEAIEPWGNIVYPSDETLSGYRCWYYCLPHGKRALLENIPHPWAVVHTDNKMLYTVVIAKDEPEPDLLPVPRTHIGVKSKDQLLQELELTELKLDELNLQRYAFTRFIYLLSLNIAKADDRAARIAVSQKALQDERLVALQGWVPESAVPSIDRLASEHKLAVVVEAASPSDQPPTLLKQSDSMESAKDLALFYQTPNYFGWDPSKLLFASFSLFFAMILADAGYGLLILTGLGLYWKRLGRSIKAKSYRLLGLSLGLSTVFYGALVGSYFGITPPEGSTLSHLHLLDINNFDVMMALSIIVGALHVGFANLSMAYVYRNRRLCWSKLGWCAIIFAAVGYWLFGDQTPFDTIAMGLGGLGLFGVIFFSSERPINRASDYLWRFLEGLFSLKNLLNAFGDVLSYMRLFALGLASASLAITFNGLAKGAQESVAGGGLLLALLILLIGHTLNFGLSLMSGVVHGLRLNYIEFYNWGQPDEGEPFKKFARTEVDHDGK